MATTFTDVFGWLQSAPSLLFGQKEPAGTKSTTGYSPGVDIPLNLDTPVGNLIPGQVVAANYAPWGGQVDIATVLNGQTTVEEYLHLDQIGVQLGQFVPSGGLVGLSGGQLSGGAHPATPSFSTGPHIKYSLFQGATPQQIAAGNWGQAVNPSGVLAAAQQALASNQPLSYNPGTGPGVLFPGGPIITQIGNAFAGAANGALSSLQIAQKVYGFVTSGDFAKILIGSLFLLAAFIIFIIPPATKTAATVLPIIAAGTTK